MNVLIKYENGSQERLIGKTKEEVANLVLTKFPSGGFDGSVVSMKIVDPDTLHDHAMNKAKNKHQI